MFSSVKVRVKEIINWICLIQADSFYSEDICIALLLKFFHFGLIHELFQWRYINISIFWKVYLGHRFPGNQLLLLSREKAYFILLKCYRFTYNSHMHVLWVTVCIGVSKNAYICRCSTISQMGKNNVLSGSGNLGHYSRLCLYRQIKIGAINT